MSAAYHKILDSFADEIPQLGKAEYAVFLWLGLRGPAELSSIQIGTHLSSPSLKKALELWEARGHISRGRGNSGETLYSVSAYIWNGSDSEMPEQALAVGKNFFTSHDVVVLPDSTNEELSTETSFMNDETKKVFAEIGVEGSNLDLLAGVVDERLAGNWADWVDSHPVGFKAPVGFLVKRLKENPKAEPPYVKHEHKREAHFQGELFERMKEKRGH